jgi:hypothetical protein
MVDAFAIKDCALIAISMGKRAQNLRELKERLENIHPGCIYYHFWGGLLHPRFDDPEFQNDFASWAFHGLHDLQLAERLGIIDPTSYADMEELRRELIDVIEERLDESEIIPWSNTDRQFYFMRSKIVVFDTTIRVSDPKELKGLLPHLPVSSIFYHFIDARRRPVSGTVGHDDFSRWLSNLGDEYTPLANYLTALDPYFISLHSLRDQIFAGFEKHLPG